MIYSIINIDCDKIDTAFIELVISWNPPRITDEESKDEGGADEGSFGGPRPMLPYSSMFILGSTNPYVPPPS